MHGNVGLGLAGMSVSTGTHICGLFRGRAERNAMVGAFVRAGLGDGAKCVCVIDEPDPATITEALDIDTSELDPETLEVRVARDAYTGLAGFSRPGMLAYWQSWTAEALASGAYRTIRLTGEMTVGISEKIDSTEWLRYESELNYFVPHFPQVLLCLYDIAEIDGRLLVEIIKTHPMVLIGDTVLENLYYVDPDSYTPEIG
ncbi:MEDS domain-containing protein [Actinophytocola sp.]|uniref:MEDS domain-containing protein n=1 Tax=Actinophytocola sp. TaxID=1872138 RepID=UPI002ED9EEAF